MRKNRIIIKLAAMGLGIMMIAGNTLQTEAKVLTNAESNTYRQFFDAEYYYNTYTDLQQAIGNDSEKLYQHFASTGINEGRSGNAEFNLRAYIQQNADLMATFGENYGAYLTHYRENGKAEGRSAVWADNSADNGNIIGSYSTVYDVSEQRAVNVELAAARINGTVINPGDTFSFSKTVLPRTTKNGYVMGPAFSAGKEIESIGGGICQVSSTLYVAMIRAALPSTERHTHSGIVEYVPLGLDATIAGNAKDLEFKNIYAESMTLLAEVKDGVLTVSIQLGSAQ